MQVQHKYIYIPTFRGIEFTKLKKYKSNNIKLKFFIIILNAIIKNIFQKNYLLSFTYLPNN